MIWIVNQLFVFKTTGSIGFQWPTFNSVLRDVPDFVSTVFDVSESGEIIWNSIEDVPPKIFRRSDALFEELCYVSVAEVDSSLPKKELKLIKKEY